jgi:type II secretory pathway pseudopilin PulG
MEITLVIAILSIIMVMGIVSGTASSERRKFQHAVDQLETTLRMARAEAANTAHRIRLKFDEETRLPTLLWEPAPLTEPGIFEAYTTCSWISRLPKDRIAITRCRITGPDGKPVDEAPAGVGDDTDNEEMRTITFNQDGSSDSVLIELESTDQNDSLRAAIKLDGENSIITTKILYSQAEDDEEDPFAEDETEITE